LLYWDGKRAGHRRFKHAMPKRPQLNAYATSSMHTRWLSRVYVMSTADSCAVVSCATARRPANDLVPRHA